MMDKEVLVHQRSPLADQLALPLVQPGPARPGQPARLLVQLEQSVQGSAGLYLLVQLARSVDQPVLLLVQLVLVEYLRVQDHPG